MASRLSTLFEIRHILTNEIPKGQVYSIGDIEDFLTEARRFTNALEEVLTFKRFGLVPLTQTEINIRCRRRSYEEGNGIECIVVGDSNVFSSARKGWQKLVRLSGGCATKMAFVPERSLRIRDVSQSPWNYTFNSMVKRSKQTDRNSDC